MLWAHQKIYIYFRLIKSIWFSKTAWRISLCYSYLSFDCFKQFQFFSFSCTSCHECYLFNTSQLNVKFNLLMLFGGRESTIIHFIGVRSNVRMFLQSNAFRLFSISDIFSCLSIRVSFSEFETESCIWSSSAFHIHLIRLKDLFINWLVYKCWVQS